MLNLIVLADKLKKAALGPKKLKAVKKPSLVKKSKAKKPTLKPQKKSIKPIKVSKGEAKKKLNTRLLWWNKLSRKEQREYLKEHPRSKLEVRKSGGPIKDKDRIKTKNLVKKTVKTQDKVAKKVAKKIKPKPITKNKTTTKLFKVDQEQVNKVPPKKQQEIKAIINKAIPIEPKDDEDKEHDSHVADNSKDVDSDDTSDNSADNSKDDDTNNNGKADSEDENESNDDEDSQELEDRVNQQLHPQQKLSFINAAKIAISKKSSKEDKEKALKKLAQLHWLVTATKIAGAATTAALIYHFGSMPNAQCATYFGLEHSSNFVQNSSSISFLKRWGRARATGEELKEDEDDKFSKLLGTLQHKASHSSGHHKKHH